MALTTNMGLTKWASGSDFFSRAALATDWDLVDAHDHTTGKGVQIPTGGLANLAVDATKLADSAVTEAKILDGVVSAAKVKAEAWTTYTPSLTGGSIGSGSGAIKTGKSIKLGNTVIVQGHLLYGSTGFSGTPTAVTLPHSANEIQLGTLIAVDVSTSTSYYGACMTTAGSNLLFSYTPFTWAAGDYLYWAVTYEH